MVWWPQGLQLQLHGLQLQQQFGQSQIDGFEPALQGVAATSQAPLIGQQQADQ